MKEQSKQPVAPSASSLPELQKMIARFAPIQLQVDVSGLSANDQKAIAKLISVMETITYGRACECIGEVTPGGSTQL